MAKKGKLKVYHATYGVDIKTNVLVIAPSKKMAKKGIEVESTYPPHDLKLKRIKVKPHFVQVLKREVDDKVEMPG